MKLNIWKKLNLSWNYFVENWKVYIWTNVVYGFIAILIWLLGLGIMFLWLKPLIFGNGGVWLWLMFLWLITLLIAGRIGKALSFVSNFYITKSQLEGKKLTFKEAFKKWISNLKYRVLLDVWYFIIGLWAILWFWLFVWLWFAINRILGIVLFVVWVYFLIKIYLMFYLSDYYCFDNNKFDFKTFLESRKLIKWKYWYLFLNMIVLIVILWLSYVILMLPFQPLNPHINFYWWVHSMYQITVLLTSLFTLWAIVYKIIDYLVGLIINIYAFVYFFFVYEEVKKSDNETKKENPAS